MKTRDQGDAEEEKHSGHQPEGKSGHPREPPSQADGVVPAQKGLAQEKFHPDIAEPLSSESFPHPPRAGGTRPPTTIQNVEHILKSCGVTYRYNVIGKKSQLFIPGLPRSPDNADNVAITHVISLGILNGLSPGQIPAFVEALCDKHQYNPAADWITSKPWDGKNRFREFSETLTERRDFPTQLKLVLMSKWLRSAVAAVLMPHGFRARGVLTLQGPQSIGKTAWVASLVPDPILKDGLIKLDHHLDANNKDSVMTAVSHWITEIGELDSSFRKDPGRLKGFLTNSHDKLRRPYARVDSEYPRRTVFCATVNDDQFLVDLTGNTRWWTIPVTKINYNHDIDMQQLFAQIAEGFNDGKEWWLTREEEELLEQHNMQHRKASAIRDLVMDSLDLNKKDSNKLPAMSASEFLRRLEIKNPSNAQAKECGAVLREHLGDPKKLNGTYKWRIPLLDEPIVRVDDDDEY